MAGALSCCLAFFRWFPVIFIASVIAWSYYAYVINLCFLLDPPISVPEKVIYIILYHPLFVMFLWAYWKAIFTDPATVPEQFYLDDSEYTMYKEEPEEHRKRDILAKVVRDKNMPVNCRTHHNGMRICEKCQCIKPDRAHHCSVCGTCILKMDHHCPWVNNCVCYNTYKFFIMFLAYGLIYCLYIVITVAQYFVKFWTEPGKGNFHVLFLFFAAAMFAISLTSLFGYHCYLTARNKSTLESFRPPIFRAGPEKDGYNLGSYTNFIQIFGERKLYWFLPVFSSLGDGATYPTRTPAALSASYGTNDSPSESDTIFSSKVNLYEANP